MEQFWWLWLISWRLFFACRRISISICAATSQSRALKPSKKSKQAFSRMLHAVTGTWWVINSPQRSTRRSICKKISSQPQPRKSSPNFLNNPKTPTVLIKLPTFHSKPPRFPRRCSKRPLPQIDSYFIILPWISSSSHISSIKIRSISTYLRRSTTSTGRTKSWCPSRITYSRLPSWGLLTKNQQ